LSGAKLRRPWSVKRLAKPAKSVTVFLLEERGGLCVPVVERHENCRGMTHETCTVVERSVADRGFTTMLEAEDALSAIVEAIDQRGKA
jgi:hypothetical protein